MKRSIGLALLAGLIGAAPAWGQQSFGQMGPAPGPSATPPGASPAAPRQAQPLGGASLPGPVPGPSLPAPNVPAPAATAPPPGGPGFGASVPLTGSSPIQALLQAELRDWGVPPQAQLHDQLHGPTPGSIPGGQVITTDKLLALYQQGQQTGLLVFDVLGSGYMLPMAQNALGAAQPGSFDDTVQQEFGRYLQGVTQGRPDRPMVFYCQGPQCWMSYNAALRAIRLGYTQVYWYRGGIEAWQQMQQLAAGMQQAPPPTRPY